MDHNVVLTDPAMHLLTYASCPRLNSKCNTLHVQAVAHTPPTQNATVLMLFPHYHSVVMPAFHTTRGVTSLRAYLQSEYETTYVSHARVNPAYQIDVACKEGRGN